MNENADRGFKILLEMVQKDLGFHGSQYKEKCLKRRFNARMRRHNLEEDYLAYVKYLESNPAEYELLLKSLTINVTKFFRNWPVYAYMQDVVLPELLEKKKGFQTLRVWSAGCASGEEPYSLAILLLELKKNFAFHNHCKSLLPI